MECPACKSSNIDQTGKFDLTLVEPSEARHDFECVDCGCLFQIIYHPINTVIVEEAEACSDS